VTRGVLGTLVAAILLLGSAVASPRSWADPVGGGTPRWTTTYDKGSPAWTNAVALTPDGSTVVETGRSVFPGGHMATVAYDAGTGAVTWAAEFPASDDEFGTGYALATSPDGSTVYVGGWTECMHGCTASSFEGFVTVAYDVATGDKIWVARHAGNGGAPQTVAVSPDGTRIYVSATDGVDSSYVLAYDATTGAEAWTVQVPKAEGYYGGGLVVSPDGSTLVVTETTSVDDLYCDADGIITTAYDAADGTPKWTSTYAVPGARAVCGTATDIGMSPDGSAVYVTGYGGAGNHQFTYRAVTIAYDTATGDQTWAVEDTGISTLAGDSKVSLAVDPDGSTVFVAGDDCSDYPSCSSSTLAYDADTGARRWISRYNGGGRTYTADLTVSPDGRGVFVTGSVSLPCYAGCTFSESDAPLVAYDPETGTERWATTFPNNGGSALAASPDSGSLYLAGTFAGSAATSRAKSCEGQCGYSATRFNTRPGPGIFQDPENAFRYDGWRGAYAADAVAGAYRESDARGATATLHTPRATTLTWLTREGPDQGKAKLVVDGRVRGVYNLYAADSAPRSVTLTGLARRSHTVRVKVLGRNAAASRGAWVAIDGFTYRGGNGIAEESSPRVHFDTWAGVSNRHASGGSFRRSSARGSAIGLEFKGRRLKWITATGPAYGRARVVIDGRSHNVDLYRPTRHWKVAFTFDHLASGVHHVTIRATGRKDVASRSTAVVVDALVVRRH
jgi:hypothetical protein